MLASSFYFFNVWLRHKLEEYFTKAAWHDVWWTYRRVANYLNRIDDPPEEYESFNKFHYYVIGEADVKPWDDPKRRYEGPRINWGSGNKITTRQEWFSDICPKHLVACSWCITITLNVLFFYSLWLLNA